MPSLLRHPVARFITVTALVGSLADWILFATLVVTVDALIGGGPWATALVLLVRIVPSVLFAPLAARRADRTDLGSLLDRHELLRLGAVVGLAIGFGIRSVPMILAGLLALEFAAAMQAAARESVISRHVPRSHFTALNTATAVVAYGMLPVGPVIVGLVGPTTGWVLAVTGYGTLVLAYRVVLRLDRPVAATSDTGTIHDVGVEATSDASDHGRGASTSWRRVTIAAALGVLPAVALFALGPSFAASWLGDRGATGPLFALVLGGGAVGFVLANRRGFRADLAMVVAAGGLGMALTGWWVPGLALLGMGAGGAYLDLQTRLQHAATDPSEFAAAFAILKVATAAAVAGAPALAAVAPLSMVLVVGAIAAVTGAAVASPAPQVIAERAVRVLLEGLVRLVVRVEVIDADRRVTGTRRRLGPPTSRLRRGGCAPDGRWAGVAGAGGRRPHLIAVATAAVRRRADGTCGSRTHPTSGHRLGRRHRRSVPAPVAAVAPTRGSCDLGRARDHDGGRGGRQRGDDAGPGPRHGHGRPGEG